MASSSRSSGPSGIAFSAPPTTDDGMMPTRHREAFLTKRASLTGPPETRMKPRRAIMPVPPVPRRPSCRHGLVLLAFTLGAFVPACGKGRPVVHPVSGRVLFENKPIANAFIVLHPVDAKESDAVRPHGQTDQDGNFHLSSFADGDGAPSGEYLATVEWRPLSERDLESSGPPSNRLPPRYARADRSGLRVRIDGPTELAPWRLTR